MFIWEQGGMRQGTTDNICFHLLLTSKRFFFFFWLGKFGGLNPHPTGHYGIRVPTRLELTSKS